MRIGLAGWAINRRFRDEKTPLAALEFPRVAREEFDIDLIELNNVFLASHEDDYLKELVQSAWDQGVEMLGMAVDGTGNLSALDADERAEAVRKAMVYFDVSEKLGLSYFRVNTGGSADGPPEMLSACVDSFQQLAQEGEKRGIKIVTENHGGLSTDPAMMVKLLVGVDSPAMGSLPDFGNFPEEIVLPGMAQILPFAAAAHVKWTRRDSDRNVADGKRDVVAFVQLCRQMGFDGALFIEDGGACDHRGVLELKGALLAAINNRG
ncbi:MAG: sugar phosphate isomerase/epimerase [Lentisphaerae bacterium]|jgi:L-ribulose-5-phosphate 3-epimerase|nr:sugar phosphate isomerase/epimerase [Lentisphaerota bacterium]MBT4821606.1 sugar phosphate isomerase/epimerase [Lentisphaerota bacterium]MBT5608150.1 sugar phosphate isomerase/epimerase [Lentisphaerota bacterium]MBT7058698.1 sugar phosphate isomerase/epimerase [Lentisphaerota bacterium]MBT7847672.1 sugar phosphate isomerase/epimerase [Lentisphaerota bacterium]